MRLNKYEILPGFITKIQSRRIVSGNGCFVKHASIAWTSLAHFDKPVQPRSVPERWWPDGTKFALDHNGPD